MIYLESEIKDLKFKILIKQFFFTVSKPNEQANVPFKSIKVNYNAEMS